MTTPAQTEAYRQAHVKEYEGRPVVVHNPRGVDPAELPVIYACVDRWHPNAYFAEAISEDGSILASHVCSSEDYVPADLGVIEGASSTKHEKYQEYYPDGYRMEFVSLENRADHGGLHRAIARYNSRDVKRNKQ